MRVVLDVDLRAVPCADDRRGDVGPVNTHRDPATSPAPTLYVAKPSRGVRNYLSATRSVSARVARLVQTPSQTTSRTSPAAARTAAPKARGAGWKAPHDGLTDVHCYRAEGVGVTHPDPIDATATGRRSSCLSRGFCGAVVSAGVGMSGDITPPRRFVCVAQPSATGSAGRTSSGPAVRGATEGRMPSTRRRRASWRRRRAL